MVDVEDKEEMKKYTYPAVLETITIFQWQKNCEEQMIDYLILLLSNQGALLLNERGG